MDIEFDSQDKIVRKIEDIIDIQKANGNINVRQVAFKLPSETNNNIPKLRKSLENGLSKSKSEKSKKKAKKSRKKYKKETSDVISWPSDSDITVLRMKLCANDINEKLESIVLGDGLHQPSSSSMVNLATLMLQSQRPSKHSLDVDEYLLPLTSWELALSSTSCCQNAKLIDQVIPKASNINLEIMSTESTSQKDRILENSNNNSESTKSKLARFLRLYFCPCCVCLYEMEKMQNKLST